MNLDHHHDHADDGDRSPRRPLSSTISPTVGFLLVLLGVVAGATAFWAGGKLLTRHQNDAQLTDPNAKPREPTPTEPRDAEEREGIDLFKKVAPSVVNVDIVQLQRTPWDDRPAAHQTGTGSGF